MNALPSKNKRSVWLRKRKTGGLTTLQHNILGVYHRLRLHKRKTQGFMALQKQTMGNSTTLRRLKKRTRISAKLVKFPRRTCFGHINRLPEDKCHIPRDMDYRRVGTSSPGCLLMCFTRCKCAPSCPICSWRINTVFPSSCPRTLAPVPARALRLRPRTSSPACPRCNPSL